MPCIEDYFVSRLRRTVIISSQVPGVYGQIPRRKSDSHYLALQELLVLASSDIMIGSYMSTFIETAWWISGAKKPIHVL